MNMKSLPIHGAFEIFFEPIADERGEFSRIYCFECFEKNGLNTNWNQQNLSRNIRTGTARGLHFQQGKFSEIKLVRCINGSVLDLILDLRPTSPSFKKFYRIELSPKLNNCVYIPKGCAHGYLTLQENSDIMYLSSSAYSKENESGVNLMDPLMQYFDYDLVKAISKRDSELQSLEVLLENIEKDPEWFL